MDEENHQKHQYAHRKKQQNRGIHECRRDLRLDVFFARLEIGDLREHDIEKASRFTRLDHRHVNPRERVGRTLHRLRERHAVDHEVVDFLPFLLRDRFGGLAVQNHQRTAEGHARRQQAGEQTREVLQHPRRDLRLAAERDVKTCRGLTAAGTRRLIRRMRRRRIFRGRRRRFDELDRFQATAFNLTHRFVPVARIEETFG